MITTTHNAKDLFVVRRKNALAGNPAWADLTIDSNRTLRKELARGAGLYAIHFRGTLLYVGKFCGKQSDPFDGRVCDIRWARHIGTLTLRDRRISLSEGRCKQLRGSMTSPLVDIVSAMQASTIYQNRGRATSINRALFAAEHWAEFARIEDEAGLAGFTITYTQMELTDCEDRHRVRGIVSAAEKNAIDQLQPRCNGEVRQGAGRSAAVPESAAVLVATLEHALAEAGGGIAPPPELPPDITVEMPDDDGPDDGPQNRGGLDADVGPAGPGDADDPAEVTAEELFWKRIDDEPQALASVTCLIEALANIPEADYHFTKTNSADIRVHSLAGPRPRFNVTCYSWQTKWRRFKGEIYLSVEDCLALGATSAQPNYANKTLPTIVTFDHDCQPEAMQRCTLASLDLYRLAQG